MVVGRPLTVTNFKRNLSNFEVIEELI